MLCSCALRAKQENAISKEQYYFDLLKPRYNILTTAGSKLGYIHSEIVELKLSNSSKGRKFSEETKKLLSLAVSPPQSWGQ